MLPVRELLSNYAAQAAAHSTALPRAGDKAATWVEAEVGVAATTSCPRALCLQDFKSALAVIKPTSIDQASFALH